jgi:hypothetical protein
MEYLNRTNSYAYLNIIFVGIVLLSLVVLFALLRNVKKIKILWMFLFACLFAFSTAVPLFSYLINVSYPLPTVQTDYTHVCFDQQHSSFNISIKPTASLGNNKNNYGTFFVWTQRVGCIPSLEKNFKDTTANGDIIVIINPTHPFTESEIQMLTSYLENGGRVLLMDSITNIKSTANELIGTFGIWVTTNTDDHRVYHNVSEIDGDIPIGNITSSYLALSGGKRILIADNNVTYASMIEFLNATTGKQGKLVVVVDSYTFSDTVMGGTFTEPTERQRQIYKTEFFLFDSILKT